MRWIIASKSRTPPGSLKWTVGLNTQDKRIEERFAAQNIAILTAVDKRLEKLEQRFIVKLNSLTNTLEHFLKRLTDTEEEFVTMKHDVDRIKAVVREKLGFVLDYLYHNPAKHHIPTNGGHFL